ncbi:hypothetical protein [uncultured Gimesia sp.]|uniref:hypothetical protein n=1 Tax=uncultured Gimesia sp. TaxID=1678688 RepID=UPI002602B781|nr:hypothetical protein [uncultured Gimesia sp.]
MIGLLSIFILFLLSTAAGAEPLRYFLPGAGFVLLCLNVNHFVEGRADVKIVLLRDGWLMAGVTCPYAVDTRPKAVDKWCSLGTSSRDVEIHFSETRDFSSAEFERL